MKCKHCDEFTWICVNPDCQMCADVCPVPDTEGVCKFEEREETAYELTLKGCATVALMGAGLVKRSEDPAIDVFWSCFSWLMTKFGYAPKEDDQ